MHIYLVFPYYSHTILQMEQIWYKKVNYFYFDIFKNCKTHV